MSADDEREASSHRVLKTVVLGVSAEDEYALLESTDGAKEQFILKRSTAGSSWRAIHAGSVVVVMVTSDRGSPISENRITNAIPRNKPGRAIGTKLRNENTCLKRPFIRIKAKAEHVPKTVVIKVDAMATMMLFKRAVRKS